MKLEMKNCYFWGSETAIHIEHPNPEIEMDNVTIEASTNGFVLISPQAPKPSVLGSLATGIGGAVTATAISKAFGLS